MNVQTVFYGILIWSFSILADSSDPFLQQMDTYVATLAQAPYVNCHVLHESQFKHERVRNAIAEIAASHSYVPLQKTWQELQQDPSLHRDEVARDEIARDEIAEFSVALIMIYSSVILHMNQNVSTARVNWFSLIALYAQLSKIPLHKLFAVLEECWQQYQELMALFPKDENESWGEWLQENWWLPTTVVAFTLFSFMRWYQGRLQKQQPLSGQKI